MQHLHVVLDAVIELVEQHFLVRLGLLAFADVDQHVHGADKLAVFIAQGRRIGNEGNARAVGTLGDCLDPAHRTIFPEHDRHGGLVVRQGCPVGTVQIAGNGPPIVADLGSPACELDDGLIIEGDTCLLYTSPSPRDS